MGAPHSRNSAILAANGEFLTGLDDDDRFHCGRVAGFVAYWDLLKSLGEHVSCLYSQDVIESLSAPDYVTRKPGSVAYHDLFRKNVIGNQIYAPKEAFIQAGMFDVALPAWQDLDMFIRILKCRGPARLLDAGMYILNQDPRTDRISRQSRLKLDRAYKMLVAKSVDATAAMKQALLMQLLDDFYGFRITFRDLFEFASYGFDGYNYLQLLKLVVKRLSRK
jgi:hypothetical protein